MDLNEAVARAKEELTALLGLEVSGVTAASPIEGGWRVTLEFVERKAVPETQDLLGVYEVELDEERMIRYVRKRTRRRTDIEETVE